MKKLYQFTNIILIVFFAALILARLFMTLEAIGIVDTDEAKHAAEAYEMYKRHAWIVHTYYWETDYMNSKPPLYYWLTNIFFSIFGVSIGVSKLPSAVAGAILCGVLSVFTYKLLSKRFEKKLLALISVLLFMACYLTMDNVFDYHGFRSTNFDAVYALFVLTGMVFFFKAREDNKYLIPVGLCFGLAFLSKGFNLTSIVLCAVISIPFLAKKDRIKYILYSVLTATLVVLPWAVLRFLFDGTAFFYQGFFGEADDKVKGWSFEYFQAIPGIITFRLLFFGILFYLIAVIVKEKSLKGALDTLWADLKEYALLWVWMIVPLLFYSWAGSCADWYIYTSYIIAALLFAIYVSNGVIALSESGSIAIVIANIVVIAFIVVCAKIGITEIVWWSGHSGTGGGLSYQFRGDLKEIREKYGDDYLGSDVYMEDFSRYDPQAISDELFYDMVAYSEYEYDWHAMKGGIDAWENAEDGIIVINKDLFDQYIDRLMGHVIIEDNGYLYFTHDMY